MIKKRWTSLAKNKPLMIFLFFLIVISFIMGIYYNFKLSDNSKLEIINSLKTYATNIANRNYFLAGFHIFIITISFIFSFIFLGTILSIFFLLYEAFSLGFLLNNFIINYNFSGFLFFLFYFLLIKAVFLILLLLFIKKLLKINKILMRKIFKKDDLKMGILSLEIKKSIVIIFLFVINEIVILVFLGKILSYFSFLLK